MNGNEQTLTDLGGLATVTPAQAARDKLREGVRKQALRAGDKLLAEARLAATLGVSVRSVADALAGMVDDGLVTRRRGHGTFLTRAGAEWAAVPADESMDEASIGLLLHGSDGGMSAAILVEIERRSAASGVLPLASFTGWNQDLETRALAMMAREGVRTVAFVACPNDELMRDFYAHWPDQYDMRFVSLIRPVDSDMDAVTFDRAESARGVTERLRRDGCVDVLFSGMDDGLDARRTVSGMAEARAGLDGDFVFGLPTDPAVAERLVQRVREASGRVGIITKNIRNMAATAAALRAGGLRIPRDVVMAGFDMLKPGYVLDFPYVAMVPPCGALAELLVARARDWSNGVANETLRASLAFKIEERPAGHVPAMERE